MRKIHNSVSHLMRMVALLVAVAISGQGWADAFECGELRNYSDIGPWDYADPSSSASTGSDPMGRIKRVENVHFNPDMKMLNTKRYSIEKLTAEIHYTLRVFPNHPEALVAISRLERMVGGKLSQQSVTIFTPRISAHCFFDRAIRFRPEDKAVRFSYAIHLHQSRKYQEALEQYRIAEPHYDDNRMFHYNFALLLTEMKNWKEAFEYAQRAYSAGVTFPALRERLEKAGYKIDLNIAKPAATEEVPVTKQGTSAGQEPEENVNSQ